MHAFDLPVFAAACVLWTPIAALILTARDALR